MDVFPVDDSGRLLISPAFDDWREVAYHEIDVVIDLEGGLDLGVPAVPNQYLYIYFPIDDDALPALPKLTALGGLGADLVHSGQRVLSHCGMGFNRSALVAGVILHRLGLRGPEIVARIRQRRPGALFNDVFAAYLQSLGE